MTAQEHEVLRGPGTRTWLLRSGAVIAPALVVPFAVTGLLRLGNPDWVTLLVCALAVPALLLRTGPYGRWAASGWLVGCALWAAFLFWLVTGIGRAFEGWE